jgi:hypothetical protein
LGQNTFAWSQLKVVLLQNTFILCRTKVFPAKQSCSVTAQGCFEATQSCFVTAQSCFGTNQSCFEAILRARDLLCRFRQKRHGKMFRAWQNLHVLALPL